MAWPVRRVLLHRAFHLLYHQLAWSYDAVSALVSLGGWQAWGRAALPYLTGPRVLDLGHGPGHLLRELDGAGYIPTGIDNSPQMGRLARRRLAGRGLPARLVRGRGQSLPFSAGSFDTVVATFPAPYILEPDTLAAIRRVLRPGGRLVIVPEAELTGGDPAARATEWLYRITGQRSATVETSGDMEARWQTLLGAFGFAVRHVRVKAGNSIVTVIIADRRVG